MPEDISGETVSADAGLLIQRLLERDMTVVLAESCTAGLVADLFANIPGASKVFWGSYVCYTAEAKISMLGLDAGRLDMYGLVSAETACDMARSALVKSGACIAASVTGVAGPGDSGGVCPGTVWIAAALRADVSPSASLYNFSGSRNEVRGKAAHAVLQELQNALDRDG